MSVSPAEVQSTDTGAETERDLPWVTIVWNDPVNLMSYVTYVFQTVFGYAKPKAEKLMLAALPVLARAGHESWLTVAHSPKPWSVSASRSIDSRAPAETTARPL